MLKSLFLFVFSYFLSVLMLVYAPQSWSSDEAARKARYIVYFVKYLSWPEDALAHAASPLRICVVADDVFYRSVKASSQGKAAQGRAIQVVNSAVPDDKCHFVYLQGQRSLAPDSRPSLLISESGSPHVHNSVVVLDIQSGHTKFEVNLSLLERSGARISSEFLKIAKVVR